LVNVPEELWEQDEKLMRKLLKGRRLLLVHMFVGRKERERKGRKERTMEAKVKKQ
jgi:hypothetical protein